MVEKEEYFTPSIEELFVGYKCQIYIIELNFWEEFIITEDYSFSGLSEFIKYKEICTPYLTKEQIELEGFKCFHDNVFELFFRSNEENNWIQISYDLELHIMEIERLSYTTPTTTNTKTLFIGNIKSINEFRKLLQWI